MNGQTNLKKNTLDLLKVEHLKKYYPVKTGVFQRVTGHVQAVDDVSFSVRRGETLGLVGESGCGKTTIGRAILRLTEPTSGSVWFDDQELLKLKGAALKSVRREMQIIFQDPYSSLDPRLRIGDSVMEGLSIHNIGDKRDRYQMVLDVLAGADASAMAVKTITDAVPVINTDVLAAFGLTLPDAYKDATMLTTEK